MRKLFLFLLAVSLLFMPTLAYAQNDLIINELSVQLWPEYDRSDMLVMYSFSLTEDTPLPAEVRIRIPANAEINAVAKISADTMLTVPYDPPIQDGDWTVITLVIDELRTYRVEYYTPLEKNGTARNFSFLWESKYDVNFLSIEFQKPPNATNLTTSPTLENTSSAQEGISYHTLLVENISADKAFLLELSYEKANDDLTVSSMPVEVGGIPESDTGGFYLNDSLPTLLVGLGILLIVGGLLYFFLAGRSVNKPNKIRKRHSPREASAEGNAYCHECGGRARSGDKFCRACGVKLRL